MAKSDTTEGMELACGSVAENAPQKSGIQRIHRRLGQWAAGISAGALGITVAAMAAAQTGGKFKAAPKAPEAEGDTAAAASEIPDVIFGIPVNTMFFVAAGVVAVFWFTLGGGRKPKVSRK